jgi:hypothetical protein
VATNFAVRGKKMSKQSKINLAVQAIKQREIKDDLRSLLEQSIDQRVNRYLEINHHWIIGNHHFAAASAECIELYRDGYFIGAVMMSQAVNEGIIKFIVEKNDIDKYRKKTLKKIMIFFAKIFNINRHKDIATKSISELIDELVEKNIISKRCANASKQIWGSFRNDVHHMNPKVAAIPFDVLAKRNLQSLAIIEKEIFGTDIKNGMLIPHQPKYWDLQDDGTVQAFLRISL